MSVISILTVVSFCTILCIVEIPKMLKKKQYRELLTFSILLAFGSTIAILKSLNVEIPNPLDFVAWVYSPATNIMKAIVK